MNKKALEKLHSDKCAIGIDDVNLGRRTESRYVVSFSFTAGEILAFKRVIEEGAVGANAIRKDIHSFLFNAVERAEIKL